jgi:hypothetical protein
MDFSELISLNEKKVVAHEIFFVNLILTAILTLALGQFYIVYGTAISNRRKFARTFMLLAMTTMLIIHIVQSSMALSLGLLGALSIIRFRAAIKEPEELAYLFLTIGIGLGMGANEPIITITSFAGIVILLYLQSKLVKKHKVNTPESMFINISVSGVALNSITQVLARNFDTVQLKRMDQVEGRLHLSYVINTDLSENISVAKDELLGLSPELTFSFVEQRNLGS